MNGKANVFLARAGKYGQDEEMALEKGLAIIGFDEVESLENAKDAEAIYKLVEQGYPGASAGKLRNFTGQLRIFAQVMKPGDIVVLPRKLTSQIALGIVKGPYEYREVGDQYRHTRKVEWLRPDVPRTAFEQDLLFSFGAFMTVCQITRHDAERRVAAVLEGKDDPRPVTEPITNATAAADLAEEGDGPLLQDVAQFAHDQIVQRVQSRFAGHALSQLVEAVLQAEGWTTTNSPPGADGGVDILAGRGFLGLDAPRLCVQVKSQNAPADVNIYRNLQGVMQTFKAEQGLLVCWGGFNKIVQREARQAHFSIRLWDSSDLIHAIYRYYERLPAEIQAELPLKRVWMLVPDDEEA